MASSSARGDSGWTLGNTLWKSAQALERAAQGGGGVTNLGGVQGTFRCCVEGHGLVRTIGDGCIVWLDDLVGLFHPWWFYGRSGTWWAALSQLGITACCRSHCAKSTIASLPVTLLSLSSKVIERRKMLCWLTEAKLKLILTQHWSKDSGHFAEQDNLGVERWYTWLRPNLLWLLRTNI